MHDNEKNINDDSLDLFGEYNNTENSDFSDSFESGEEDLSSSFENDTSDNNEEVAKVSLAKDDKDIAPDKPLELDLMSDTPIDTGSMEDKTIDELMAETDELISNIKKEDEAAVDFSEGWGWDDEVQEMDDTDLGSDYQYVQDGVYINNTTGTATIDEKIVGKLVDANGYYSYETGAVDKTGKKVVKKMKVKRYKKKKVKTFDIGILKEENFGVLLPLIKDINVTDINWNGKQCWVDDVNKGRYLSDIVLDKDFVDAFSIRVSNVVSKTFNKYTPSLEAETDELRITIIHESISHTGRAISIRKTPALKRINFLDSIRNGQYCSEQVANLLSNSVKAKMNIVVCGLPGVGKTELVKFLTNYIFPRDRVITVEDTLEVHYADINPGKDCLEFKVSPNFTYTDAIKESLRLLPQWVLLSEARSVEVRYLLESVSTGTKCMTTLHTDDVRKIPDRVVNMVGDINQAEIIENSVYSFFDIGILIDKKVDEQQGTITRWISQVCLFTRINNRNKCIMLAEDGILTRADIPKEYMKKYETVGIKDPYKYTYI